MRSPSSSARLGHPSHDDTKICCAVGGDVGWRAGLRQEIDGGSRDRDGRAGDDRGRADGHHPCGDPRDRRCESRTRGRIDRHGSSARADCRDYQSGRRSRTARRRARPIRNPRPERRGRLQGCGSDRRRSPRPRVARQSGAAAGSAGARSGGAQRSGGRRQRAGRRAVCPLAGAGRPRLGAAAGQPLDRGCHVQRRDRQTQSQPG